VITKTRNAYILQIASTDLATAALSSAHRHPWPQATALAADHAQNPLPFLPQMDQKVSDILLGQ